MKSKSTHTKTQPHRTDQVELGELCFREQAFIDFHAEKLVFKMILGRHPFTELIVGPPLINHHNRGEDQGHNRHDL